ncbi:MAG: exodeoxyribonuclease VII large subunit, partial [Acidimicrobiales bacterium]
AELMAFSDEALCRAICTGPVPVVSAIGHDADRPLCDDVADLRCSTPSTAAAAVVPLEEELWNELDGFLDDAGSGVAAQAARGRQRLGGADPLFVLSGAVSRAAGDLVRAEANLGPQPVLARLAGSRSALERTNWQEPWHRRLTTTQSGLADRRLTLDALDPRRVLARGYALVRTAAGDYLRSPAQVAEGDYLHIEVAEGSVGARAESGPRLEATTGDTGA